MQVVRAKSNNMEKKEFIEHLNHLIDKKIDALQNRFDDLNNDLASDHKSSAGDKHETGRAMIQLEQEKLSSQLSQFSQQKETISKLNAETTAKHLTKIVKNLFDCPNVFTSKFIFAKNSGKLYEEAKSEAEKIVVDAQKQAENLKKEKNFSPYFKPPIMSSGLTHSSNCSEVSKPKLRAAALRLVPSLCAFLAIAAAFS